MAQYGQAVTIDMRALVDKILTRYSAEFPVFRELLQNSDDAECNSAEIHFETAASSLLYAETMMNDGPPIPPDFKLDVVQWTFKNHGKPFKPEDWERLPRIALGNPDPTKIGAFGVGFFSVFSVTEEPCVSSGGKEMKFWWDEKKQLRFDDLPKTVTSDLWSTIKMPLRQPAPMSPISELMRFLASSITFIVHLVNVSVFFDGHCLGQINRSQKPLQLIPIPDGLCRSSPKNTMRVESIQQHSITIDARITFPKHALHETKDITVFTAEVVVTAKFEELARSMKKDPPSHLKYMLTYTSKDEHERSHKNERKYPTPFQELRADLDGSGHTRVHIGHATAQTTGIGGHMASRFIPTVERQSMDLTDINVGTWNRELLYIGGILCRAVYESELSNIQVSWNAAASEPDLRRSRELQHELHKHFLHVLKFFTFHHSTPFPTVAEILADSFYGHPTLPLSLLSSVGVRGAPHVRGFNSELAEFLKFVPMLPEYIVQHGAYSIEKLPNEHKISVITPSDILEDLRSHALDAEQLAAFLRWWMSWSRDALTLNVVDLLSAVTFYGNAGKEISLSSITHFVNPKLLGLYIPPDGPLPLSLLPLDVGNCFKSEELSSFGWTEFTIASWLCHISDSDVMSANEKYNFSRSTDWARRILTTLSHVWSSVPEDIQRESRETLRNKPCIPTSKGSCCPECSYLPPIDNNQFQCLDLPIVSSDLQSIDAKMKSCLLSLGIQKDLPIQLLLDQIQTGQTGFNILDQLVQEKRSLTTDDISTLKMSKTFTREPSQADNGVNVGYCANELYPPVDTFRKLRLPIIKWGGKSEWNDKPSQAQLLYNLGLNRFPPLPKIMELCSKDDEVQETAFRYLCREFQSQYSDYKPESFRNRKFIPAESNNCICLKEPGEVYSDTQWKALGFFVVPERYLSMPLGPLGITNHPPTLKILDLLENTPPRDERTAGCWFEVLSKHIQAFSPSDRIKLSGLSFVPMGQSDALKLLPPTKCYLKRSTRSTLYLKLFGFVDFGDKANEFLRACGSKNQVVIEDVAKILVENPQQFFGSAGTYEDLLVELRKIAYQRRDISNATLHEMNDKCALLGVRRRKAEDQVTWHYDYKFLTSQEVVVVDDNVNYQLFSDCLFIAPQEEVIEGFYKSLGCSYLSAVVEESFCGLDEVHATDVTETCLEIQSRILDRLPLFIQKYTDTKPEDGILPGIGNFTVKACNNSIRVSKTLNTVTGPVTRSRDIRATARRVRDGGIELWISEYDVYEIATSLCRLLFRTNKTSATLLLENVLSADLEDLERRGFHVDRVPQRSRGAWEWKNKTRQKYLSNPGILSGSLEAIVQSPSRPHTTDSVLVSVHDAPANVSGDKIVMQRTPRGVIPQSDIWNDVEAAIAACGQGWGKQANRMRVRQLLGSIPCADVKGLQLADPKQDTDIQVYVHEGVPDAKKLMKDKHGPLTRFVDIISTLSEVYGMSKRALCIFYDESGGCIAFNRQGVIYLNLRYFEEWHDKQVEGGNQQDALMWWYLTLAHEIAHNEIDQHNADHEFLFSAICEARFVKFSQVLQPGLNTLPRKSPRDVLWLILSVIVVVLAYIAGRIAPMANPLR